MAIILNAFRLTPSITYDSDAQAYITAAGLTNNTHKSAVNTLVLALKAASIWTKFLCIYPILGGTSSSHAVNLKSPGTYNLTFYGGVTHSSAGVTWNGTTGYASTGMPANTIDVHQGNAHFSTYGPVNTSSDGVDMGVMSPNGVAQFYLQTNYAPDDQAYATAFRGDTYVILTAAQNPAGYAHHISNRRSDTYFVIVRNGVAGTPYTGNQERELGGLTEHIYLGALNQNNAPLYFSNKLNSFFSIGYGFSSTEQAAFYNAVLAFQTTLGRNA